MTSRESWSEIWRPWYPMIAGVFYFCQGFYTAGFVMYVTVFAVEASKLSFETAALLNATVVAPVFLKMIPLMKLYNLKETNHTTIIAASGE